MEWTSTLNWKATFVMPPPPLGCQGHYVLGALWCSGAYSRLVIGGSEVRVHPVHMPLDKAFYSQLSLSTQVLSMGTSRIFLCLLCASLWWPGIARVIIALWASNLMECALNKYTLLLWLSIHSYIPNLVTMIKGNLPGGFWAYQAQEVYKM